MKNPESVEAPGIPDIDGEQLSHAMDIHARRQSDVRYALNVMRGQEERQRSWTSRLSSRNSKFCSFTRLGC